MYCAISTFFCVSSRTSSLAGSAWTLSSPIRALHWSMVPDIESTSGSLPSPLPLFMAQPRFVRVGSQLLGVPYLRPVLSAATSGDSAGRGASHTRRHQVDEPKPVRRPEDRRWAARAHQPRAEGHTGVRVRARAGPGCDIRPCPPSPAGRKLTPTHGKRRAEGRDETEGEVVDRIRRWHRRPHALYPVARSDYLLLPRASGVVFHPWLRRAAANSRD